MTPPATTLESGRRLRKARCFAVRNGREGSKIYKSLQEAKKNADNHPRAIHKGFRSLALARRWIGRFSAQAARESATPSAPTQDITQVAGPSSYDSDSEYWSFFGEPMSVDDSTLDNNIKAEPPADWMLDASVKAEPPADWEPSEQGIVLSAEQQEVLKRVKCGRNVFFTGSAGTGKSVLLRAIIDYCRFRDGVPPAITASTGIASVNIGGCTIYSWAGIGLGKEEGYVLYCKLMGKHQKLLKEEREKWKERHARGEYSDSEEDSDHRKGATGTKAVDRWRFTKTLIIDEISMMDGQLFDKLEWIARQIRRNKRPFGGIQLVISGDFCQLPPVPERTGGWGAPNDVKFAFEAESWDRCVGKPMFLAKVFRQKEQAFVDKLNELRFAVMSEDTIAAFRKLSRRVIYEDGIEPTDLYPTRKEVAAENASRLARILHPPHRFVAIDYRGYDEAGKKTCLRRMEEVMSRTIAPQHLVLKLDAQVMLIRNLIQGELVNGSIGRVVGYSTLQDAIPRHDIIIQSQPQYEQVPDSDSDIAKNHRYKPIRRRDRAKTLIRQGKEVKIPTWLQSRHESWPIVLFPRGHLVLCVPNRFEVHNAAGGVEAVREQVPLILAWALSIHKSQGQTLERVRVDLSRIFEKGQAYVALSRATSMDTLEIISFDPGRVQAHPRVLDWMDRMVRIPSPRVVPNELFDAKPNVKVEPVTS